MKLSNIPVNVAIPMGWGKEYATIGTTKLAIKKPATIAKKQRTKTCQRYFAFWEIGKMFRFMFGTA